MTLRYTEKNPGGDLIVIEGGQVGELAPYTSFGGTGICELDTYRSHFTEKEKYWKRPETTNFEALLHPSPNPGQFLPPL